MDLTCKRFRAGSPTGTASASDQPKPKPPEMYTLKLVWKLNNFRCLYAHCKDNPTIKTDRMSIKGLKSVELQMIMCPNELDDQQRKVVSFGIIAYGMDQEDSEYTHLRFAFKPVMRNGVIFKETREEEEANNQNCKSYPSMFNPGCYMYKPESGHAYGHADFILHEKLFDPKYNLLSSDWLTIYVEAYVSKENYMPLNWTTVPNETLQSKIEQPPQPVQDPTGRYARDLAKLFLNPKNSDITFVVKGKTFPAHKNILSVRSPVFDAMFGIDVPQNERNTAVDGTVNNKKEKDEDDSDDSDDSEDSEDSDEHVEEDGNKEEEVINVKDGDVQDENVPNENVQDADWDDENDDEEEEGIEILSIGKRVKMKTVKIDDIEPETFERLLSVVYTGKALPPDNYNIDLMKAADKYMVDELKQLCECYIGNQIYHETVLETAAIAEKHNARLLLGKCIEYIARYSDEMTKFPNWTQFTEAHPAIMIPLLEELGKVVERARKDKVTWVYVNQPVETPAEEAPTPPVPNPATSRHQPPNPDHTAYANVNVL